MRPFSWCCIMLLFTPAVLRPGYAPVLRGVTQLSSVAVALISLDSLTAKLCPHDHWCPGGEVASQGFARPCEDNMMTQGLGATSPEQCGKIWKSLLHFDAVRLHYDKYMCRSKCLLHYTNCSNGTMAKWLWLLLLFFSCIPCCSQWRLQVSALTQSLKRQSIVKAASTAAAGTGQSLAPRAG
jgi:hypothetical protein